VAYKDILRIEALARRSTKMFTREVFEKNILPLQSSDGVLATAAEYSDYDLWLQKKDFERRIREDMLDQVLQDYEQQRERHMAETLKKSRERKEGHSMWLKLKRDESIRRKEEEEMKR
jgi:phenylacetate-coenzyme A ligase PaaK-like adenylate-forming protein